MKIDWKPSNRYIKIVWLQRSKDTDGSKWKVKLMDDPISKAAGRQKDCTLIWAAAPCHILSGCLNNIAEILYLLLCSFVFLSCMRGKETNKRERGVSRVTERREWDWNKESDNKSEQTRICKPWPKLSNHCSPQAFCSVTCS